MSYNKEIHIVSYVRTQQNRQHTRTVNNVAVPRLQYFQSTSSLNKEKHHLAATTDRIDTNYHIKKIGRSDIIGVGGDDWHMPFEHVRIAN